MLVVRVRGIRSIGTKYEKIQDIYSGNAWHKKQDSDRNTISFNIPASCAKETPTTIQIQSQPSYIKSMKDSHLLCLYYLP